MTTHVMTDKALPGTGREASPLINWFKGISAKLVNWWTWHQAYRHTLRELEGLNDKELDDIGLVRIDIPIVALEAADEAQAIR